MRPEPRAEGALRVGHAARPNRPEERTGDRPAWLLLLTVAVSLASSACPQGFGWWTRPTKDGLHADCGQQSDCRRGTCFEWQETAWPNRLRRTCEIECADSPHRCPDDLSCSRLPNDRDGDPPFCF